MPALGHGITTAQRVVEQHYSLCKVRREALLANFIHLRYRSGVMTRLCEKLGCAGFALPAPGDIEIKKPTATAAPRKPAAMKKRTRKRTSPSVLAGVKVCDNKLKRKRCLAAGAMIFTEQTAVYCDACKTGYKGRGIFSKKRAKLYDQLANAL